MPQIQQEGVEQVAGGAGAEKAGQAEEGQGRRCAHASSKKARSELAPAIDQVRGVRAGKKQKGCVGLGSSESSNSASGSTGQRLRAANKAELVTGGGSMRAAQLPHQGGTAKA